jgi:osmotically-inducible protein OsmY
VVTLTGPAPSESARDRAAEIAKNVKGVSSVNNQLTVKAG